MDLFKIFGTISLKGTEGFNKEIDEATNKGNSLAEAVGKGLEKASKIGIAAITAAGAAFGAILKSSIENYAEFEQLVGGVETLFKDSSNAVKGYADNAYKTAGLSANEYMSTVTSFSASLLQGLGGDTAKAAEIANLAITDMSDNANKMGSDMATIQAAYQGFAKQNYTLLDNLKLGYGGTASEMARLINDSGVLGDTMEVTAETVNSVSFDKIIQAINVVQTEMGITGTTAKEAASTIQGSVAATKSAWKNLVTGIADENADLDILINNFTESASTALGNLLPRIGQVVSGIEAVGDKVPVFGLLTDAIKLTATVLIGAQIGSILQGIVTGFQAAQVQIALYTLANGEAALASGVMTGALTAKEVIVGLLTGKITLATAAQTLWNAAINANPIMIAVTAAALLTAGVIKLARAQDDTIDALAGTATTTEEAAAKMEELKQRIEELEATDPGYWSEIQQQEYDTLRLALIETEKQYAALAEAEKNAAETGSESAEQMATDAEEFGNSAQELIDKFTEVYEGYAAKVGEWFSPFEKAKTTTKTSIAEMMAAMQSQMDFNAEYSANLQTLNEYGLASLSSAFQEYGAEGAAYAKAIVDAVEQAGGASSEGGQKIINDFLELSSGVADSQSDLATTMTTLETGMDTSIANVVTTVTQGVADIDKGVEAYDAAISTLGEYIRGIEEKTPDVLAKFSSLGSQITETLQSAIGTITINFQGSGEGLPQHANGLERVPYDGYPAILHRDEMVLPASQADYIRSGAFAEMASENNAAVINMLGQILDAVQNGGTQETILKLNDRELGRAVRGYVYA